MFFYNFVGRILFIILHNPKYTFNRKIYIKQTHKNTQWIKTQ